MKERTNHPLNYVPEHFWEQISLARNDQHNFSKMLSETSKEELLEFIWTFEEVAAEFKYEPYTGYVSSKLSEDGIDDVATWVVEQGRDYVYEVFDNPSLMPKRVDHPIGLLSKAVRTYRSRFGRPIPIRQ